MPATVLIGVQWGDEGKGKIIDVLTENADVVIRFQGGSNAGHTVEIGKEKYVLHLVPSGIFRKGTICIVGNGVVADPIGLMDEMKDLTRRGIDISSIQLSGKAHLVMCYHKLMDSMKEAKLAESGKKIGTTNRGIGPAYADKAARTGIRALEILKMANLEKLFREQAANYNAVFEHAGKPLVDINAEWKKLEEAAHYLAPYVKDTVVTVNEAIKAKKNILFEGAQGVLLDIDHGTYPFVTSSNTTTGGACTGSGVSPRAIDTVYGVVKAYTTRVGEGPFPTELHGEEGENLRKAGNEYGATTGRPRRCGWFDAVASNYSCMINGINKLAITKLDVLDDLKELKICTAYDVNGVKTRNFPQDVTDLAVVKPIYETVPGWMESTASARSFAELPKKAQTYLKRLAELVESDIGIISVGPNREQTFKV